MMLRIQITHKKRKKSVLYSSLKGFIGCIRQVELGYMFVSWPTRKRRHTLAKFFQTLERITSPMSPIVQDTEELGNSFSYLQIFYQIHGRLSYKTFANYFRRVTYTSKVDNSINGFEEVPMDGLRSTT